MEGGKKKHAPELIYYVLLIITIIITSIFSLVFFSINIV